MRRVQFKPNQSAQALFATFSKQVEILAVVAGQRLFPSSNLTLPGNTSGLLERPSGLSEAMKWPAT